jgi:8-oxo-dGTP pyrophosphatase MutT (NUDIX family)
LFCGGFFIASNVSNLPVFDPHRVPVTQVDTHLPRVTSVVMAPDALRLRFASPPHWAPEIVAEPRFSTRAAVAASVLVPLVMREQLMVLLTQRTTHLSSHSGQIAFPGGKADPEDADATATALREAQEEIGLDPQAVEVLGTMPIYTTGSAYFVTPVVALVQPDAVLKVNAFEVADVFEVPLNFLMNPANHRHHAVEWAGATRHWLSMPYQDAEQERFIWGATAGMLRNFYRFLLG